MCNCFSDFSINGCQNTAAKHNQAEHTAIITKDSSPQSTTNTKLWGEASRHREETKFYNFK